MSDPSFFIIQRVKQMELNPTQNPSFAQDQQEEAQLHGYESTNQSNYQYTYRELNEEQYKIFSERCERVREEWKAMVRRTKQRIKILLQIRNDFRRLLAIEERKLIQAKRSYYVSKHRKLSSGEKVKILCGVIPIPL